MIIINTILVSCPNDQMRELVELKVSDPLADTFIINSGAPTSSLSVTLNSDVTKEEDALEMRFRNESGNWSDWESYSKTKTWQLTPGDGTKTVYAEFRDEGHHVVGMHNNIILNTGAPAGDFYIWGSAISGNRHLYVNSASVTLCMTISNVVSMRFSNDGGTTWSSWTAYSDTYSWNLASGDGSKTVDAEFITNAGTTTASSRSITLDSTLPSVSSFRIDNNAATSNSIGVTLDYDYAESNSLWAQYMNDGGSWSSQEVLSSSPVNKSWSLRSLTGDRTVYLKLTDIAGNVSSAYSDSIYLSTAAPGIPVPTALTPTNNQKPTWSWGAVTGAVNYRYSYVNNSAWTEIGDVTEFTPAGNLSEGNHTLYIQAEDLAGNWSSSGSFTVNIDTSAPSAPASLDLASADDSGISNSDNITNKLTGLTFSGYAEPGSYIHIYANTSMRAGTYADSSTGYFSVATSVPAEGSCSITATAMDAAGNESPYSAALDIVADLTAPVISSVVINKGNTFSCSPVLQVETACSDLLTSGSDLRMKITGSTDTGIIGYSSPYNISSSSGSVSVTVYDEAGNESLPAVDTITVKSGPTDINLENQSLPSHLASSAKDLGNMSSWNQEMSSDSRFGSTLETYGTLNLWDEDWFKIYVDTGHNLKFTLWGDNGANISGIIKFEVYYDQEGTIIAPKLAPGYIDNGNNITVTIDAADFYGPDQTNVWIKIYKDPSADNYSGSEYYLDWGVDLL